MFPHPSICSSLRLRFTELAKLQCLQQSSTSINYRNYSQLRSRVNCMITDSHSKLVHPFRTNDIASHLKPHSLGAANIISRGFSKRFFSQAPSLTNKLENELAIGEKDGPLENKRTKLDEPRFLGFSPSGLKVFLKRNRYGFYVQLGEDMKGDSPKRTALGNIKEDSVTLEVALDLLRYPLTLGIDPTDGEPVMITNSIDGVAVQKGDKLAIASKDKKLGEITMEYALELLSYEVMTCTLYTMPSFLSRHSKHESEKMSEQKFQSPRFISKPLYSSADKDDPLETKRFLGFSPCGLKVFLKCGPYGFYVQRGEDAPKRTALANIKEDSVTLEVALDLLRYPLTLGIDPTDGKPVIVTLSMYSVIVKKGGLHVFVPEDKKLGEITMEYALELVSKKPKFAA